MNSSEQKLASAADLKRSIPILRFLAVLAIVGLHSQTVFIADQNANLFDRFFQEWTTSWLLRAGLPVLSAISGFLMLRGWRQEISYYNQKILRRVQSLLIPFICVSFLTIFAYALIQTLPGTQAFFAPPLISDWDLANWLNRSIIDPLNYPIYFLRDLFLIALLAPLLAFLLRPSLSAYITLGVFLILRWCQQDLWIWNIRLLAWFSAGAALGLHPEWRWRPHRNLLIGACLLWLTLTGYGAWEATVTGIRSRDLGQLTKLLGVGVFFYATLSIRKDSRLDNVLKYVVPWCFPLFLFHNPIVNIGKKIPMKFIHNQAVLPTIAWLGAWLGAAIFLVYILAPVGAKYGGKPWKLITGGR
ncbi:acyltransferase family protein [Coraliomargarita sp. SDUM461004]|uniref:Acyltransferase family protein n=1 Tax=Thalassobacterium sedimentorum TaxID=3041258 RepID=A0ABU1AM08_9BACT|nr:acyltransferase family protein [Coraliomargarita sp. SDUM461004]MDQ8195821.1 acyltransferase family protein [Coraliomargarita sp. SDUM461004]